MDHLPQHKKEENAICASISNVNDRSNASYSVSLNDPESDLMQLMSNSNINPTERGLIQLMESTTGSSKNGLPHALKEGTEALSGISMDDVNVHYNSDKPQSVGAHAYAQGNDIHLAPGQEQHLPHEAWHVVQQKQGRVSPTMQLKGINVNDSDALEKEADQMGAKAMQLNLNNSKKGKEAPINHSKTIQRSAIASLDKDRQAIVISAEFYFYGSKASQELAESTAANIQKMWNEGKGKIKIDNKEYNVEFEVIGHYKTEAQAIALAGSNKSAKYNFVRIVDGSKMSFKSSAMSLGGNHGIFIDYELGGKKSTDAHEFGHSLNWYDPEDDWASKTDQEIINMGYSPAQVTQVRKQMTGAHDITIQDGTPGIMSPRGVRVKDEYGYDGQASGKKTVDPSKRVVLPSDINKLDIDIEALKKHGIIAIGRATNLIYKEDGTYK